MPGRFTALLFTSKWAVFHGAHLTEGGGARRGSQVSGVFIRNGLFSGFFQVDVPGYSAENTTRTRDFTKWSLVSIFLSAIFRFADYPRYPRVEYIIFQLYTGLLHCRKVFPICQDIGQEHLFQLFADSRALSSSRFTGFSYKMCE